MNRFPNNVHKRGERMVPVWFTILLLPCFHEYYYYDKILLRRNNCDAAPTHQSFFTVLNLRLSMKYDCLLLGEKNWVSPQCYAPARKFHRSQLSLSLAFSIWFLSLFAQKVLRSWNNNILRLLKTRFFNKIMEITSHKTRLRVWDQKSSMNKVK